MRILAFVDTHGNVRILKTLRRLTKNIEVVLCAGDISFFGAHLGASVKTLAGFNLPVLLVHGNHESTKEMQRACSRYKNVHFIHKKVWSFQGYKFAGFGGGGFSDREVEFERWSARLNLKGLIMLSHAPPYGTSLDLLDGKHCGNKSFTNFIKCKKPLVWVCGHFHENVNKQEVVKNTLVINPGPAGKILEIKLSETS